MSDVIAFPVTLAEWERNGREVVRVRIDRFNGRDVIDLRTWYRAGAADGDLKPGRAGLTLSVRHLENLADGIGAALAHAQKVGLLDATGPR